MYTDATTHPTAMPEMPDDARGAPPRDEIRPARAPSEPVREAPVPEPPPREPRSVGTPEPATFLMGASFLGWAVAAFLTIIFLTLIALAAGPVGDAALSDAIGNGELGAGLAVATFVAVFAGYLVGGYTAGRLARGRGAWHGLGVVAWAIVVGVVAAILGANLADPTDLRILYPAYADLELARFTAPILAIMVAMLAAMTGGAMVGGLLGEAAAERAEYGPRVTRVQRGRPL